MAEKTSLVRELLKRRGKRTVGRPKREEAEKIKKAKEEGFPITVSDIAEITGVSKRGVEREVTKMNIPPSGGIKPRAWFLEKVPHKFHEVRGSQYDELVALIKTKLDVLDFNLGEEDKIRAELTFFIKRKED